MKLNAKHLFKMSLALFAMLFGAGNIIFPLILGRAIGKETINYATIGLVLTGVCIPLIGFIGVMQTQGSYERFLQSLGTWPKFFIAALCMILLGPLGAIPRCMAIAYADFAWYLPQFPAPLFSLIASVFIFFCTVNKGQVIEILGKFLGPIKIASLLLIAIVGLTTADDVQSLVSLRPTAQTQASFVQGVYAGFGTMDLLAILFFSQMIYADLVKNEKGSQISVKKLSQMSLIVTILTGTLLALVYFGFTSISALHASKLVGVADDTLLSALASKLLGTRAGIFANLTIILTCMTTAIALSASFSQFLSSFIFKNRLSYKASLILTIVLSTIMANLRLSGIMKIIMPWINFFYPALTAYAFFSVLTNIFQLKSFIPKIIFYITLVLTIFI